MADMCSDNRFELIEKFKKELIESTNIETSPEEMDVLDNILFRFWQMGYLDSIDRMPLVKESAMTLMRSGGDSVFAKALRNAGRFIQNAIDGEAPELEKIPSVDPEPKCNSCRYRNLEWYEEPCDSCTGGGESCHYKPEPERLTDDGFEAIRIHLNAYKEKLCNQRRWKEAEEYQRIIDRFMSFASAEPERKRGKWILTQDEDYEYCTCSECGYQNGENWMNGANIPFCAMCGSYNGGEQE